MKLYFFSIGIAHLCDLHETTVRTQYKIHCHTVNVCSVRAVGPSVHQASLPYKFSLTIIKVRFLLNCVLAVPEACCGGHPWSLCRSR